MPDSPPSATAHRHCKARRALAGGLPRGAAVARPAFTTQRGA
jgi:hypothetical protein